MKPATDVLGLLVGLLLAVSVFAGEDDGPIDNGALTELSSGALEQSSGFIVDRTVTNFGAEFLRAFAQAWRAQAVIEGVDLTVVEKPSARWGSTVWIEYKSRPIAKVFLQSGSRTAIKPLALNAANYVAGRVADNKLLGLLTTDPDLGKEELP